MERIKDFLLIEQEYLQRQEDVKPHEAKETVRAAA